MNILLKNGRILDPSQGLDFVGSLLIEDDQIIAYGKDELIRNCTGSMHSTIEAAG